MAVKQEGGGNRIRFQGLSSDDKPLTSVQDGAEFHVVDTGEVYVFHDGIWTPDLRIARALKIAASL